MPSAVPVWNGDTSRETELISTPLQIESANPVNIKEYISLLH